MKYKLTIKLENNIGGIDRTVVFDEVTENIQEVIEDMQKSLDSVKEII